MSKWKRYKDFGRIMQLKNSGRELIGKEIQWTEKRDGSNISFWINDEHLVCISSHNLEQADNELINKVLSTDEYDIIFKEIMQEKEFENCIMFFELISPGRGPTRIEPPHKKARLVLFDIYNTKTDKYYTYNYCFQIAHKFKIPIVKLLDTTCPTTIEELFETRDRLLAWCKRHRREGVVGKAWFSTDAGYESIYFKEKIDLPKLKPMQRPKENEVRLPPMPTEKIFNAVDQAREECERAGNDFSNPRFGMPLVVAHLNTQGREHSYAVPRDMFQIYQQYLENKIKKGGESNGENEPERSGEAL